MQDQHIENKDWYSTLFNTYVDGLNGKKDSPMANFRKNGFDRLQIATFPTRRDEDWKYINLSKILNTNYHEGKLKSVSEVAINNCFFDDLDVYKIVFINGILSEDHSQISLNDNGLKLMSLSEAIEDEIMSKWIDTLRNVEGGTAQNAFLPLNDAFSARGIVIDVAKDTKIEKPIHIVYYHTIDDHSFFTHPQLYVNCAKHSKVSVIESYHSEEGADVFTNAATRINIGENGKVHHYKLQTLAKSSNLITTTIVSQEANSTFSGYGLDLGGNIVRNNLSSQLQGSGTDTHYYGAYLGNGVQHIDNQTFIDHAMPHCQSNEVYKGILTDKARGVFNGKVLVRPDAQKTNAYQQNSSLVLSNEAIMDAKPQLEIYADDVRCSHGATIGQLDDASIFYLKSRGIPLSQARNLLQKAFVNEVIENFKHKQIRDKVLELIEQKLLS